LQRPATLAASSPFDFAHGSPEPAERAPFDSAQGDPEPVGGVTFDFAQGDPAVKGAIGACVAEGNSPDARRASGDPQDGSPRPLSSQFPKERRIRRRAEFGTVFDRGARIHGRFFTFLMLPSGLPGARLGIVASRKLGGAVERNRAKRLIREFFRRLTPPAGIAVDLVVIPKRELLAAEFTPLSKDFGNTWRRGVERLSANTRG
jgi:ribonuclease P protein component